MSLVQRRFAKPARPALLAVLVASAVGSLGTAAQAQSDAAGRAGRVSRETDRALPAAPERRPGEGESTRIDAPRAPQDALTDTAGGARVEVRRFAVQGANAIGPEPIDQLLAGFTGPSLSFADMVRAADAVTDLYRRNGLLAVAWLPRQTLREGVVRINVQESRVSAIEVLPAEGVRLRRERAEAVLRQHVREGGLVDLFAIERAMRALNALPGVRAVTELASGEGGATTLRLRLDESPRWSGQLGASNYGSRALGRTLADARVELGDPLGWGERFSLALLSAGAPLTYARLGASVPVHTSGTALSAGWSTLRFKDKRQADDGGLPPAGRSRSGTLELSQPLIAARGSNLWLALGAEQRRLRDTSGNPVRADRDIDLWRLALNLQTDSDTQFTAGTVEWRSGRAKLLDADDRRADLGTAAHPGPRVEGRFEKLTWSVAHERGDGSGWSPWFLLRGQLALERNLEDSEKLAAGGADAVRGYATGEAPSDSLTLATVELRRELPAGWQAAAFVDAAWVARWRDPQDLGANADGPIPNRYVLKSVGLGLNRNAAAGLQLRLAVARPLGRNRGRDATDHNVDRQRDGTRAWLQLAWQM